MGYTHYWRKPNGLENFDKSLPIIQDILKRHKDILAFEYDRPTESPVCDSEMIRFNGKDIDGHETFVFINAVEDFAYCKTAMKPYDIAVCECLIVLHHFTGVEVSSDGMCGSCSGENDLKVGDVIQNPDGFWKEALANVEEHYGISYDAICCDIRNEGAYYDWELKGN